MLFIELNVPQGKFTVEQRRELANALTANQILVAEDDPADAVDPGVLDWYESLTNVVVRDSDVWIAAGVPAEDGPARFLVNLYVGAWAKEIAKHLIESVTIRITEFARAHSTESSQPPVLVQVIAIPDGQYGLQGKVVRTADFTDMIAEAARQASREAPEGMFIDPVCGALVAADEAVILERDGVTHGFCCPTCRGHHARQLDEVADQRTDG